MRETTGPSVRQNPRRQAEGMKQSRKLHEGSIRQRQKRGDAECWPLTERWGGIRK